MNKQCTKCQEIRPIDCFTKEKGKKDGYCAWCKQCVAEWYKTNRKDIFVKRRTTHKTNIFKRNIRIMKTKYHVTYEQMEQMYLAQNGCCAICQYEFQTKAEMCLDHNHETGQVRQFLCHSCNHMIGHCHEKVSILSNAIEYLNKWSS